MNFLKNIFYTALLSLPFTASAYHIQGKVDLAPAYLHIDTLQSGRTIGRRDFAAVKLDSTVVFFKGFCLKPSLLWTPEQSDFISAGIGLGHCTPMGMIHSKLASFTLIPSVGITMTKYETYVTPLGAPFSVNQCFYSRAPYAALELVWDFATDWRLCGMFQFAWSVNETTTDVFMPEGDKGESKGANYALMIEHDLNQNWSINAGAGYNLSLSHEKHGLRGYGAKIGIARWF